MSCCPESSWGQLGKGDYQQKGKVERVDDLDLYIVGNGGRCIIWNYDIFGFDSECSGRTRELADLLSQEGFMVIIPDYFRGTWKSPFTTDPLELMEWARDKTTWTKRKLDWENIVLPTAKKHGAHSFGCVGTCWGSYMVVRLSSYPGMKAGVSMHPSHTKLSALLGEDEKELLAGVICPQLFMPAKEDSPETKPGGLGQQVLGDKLEILEFPDMHHGWTTRGDMSMENMERDVKKAMQAAVDFLKKNV